MVHSELGGLSCDVLRPDDDPTDLCGVETLYALQA